MKNKRELNTKLDSEEQWYEDHSDEFIDAGDDLRNSLIEAARQTVRKTERMNIRMTKRDMMLLRETATREGIPYQTLVTSIIHKYTEGLLVDVREARKLFNVN